MNRQENLPRFSDKLCEKIRERKTPVMVGLDPRLNLLPTEFQVSDSSSPKVIADTFQKFCQGIIDVVADLVPAVKPNAAFFEALGPCGMEALANVNGYARDAGLVVVMDAKRGDIGSTAEAYARAFLGDDNPWHSDALTVNPYMGEDTVEPFLSEACENARGIFVLVKTSNPGSATFQNVIQDEQMVYQRVATAVEKWNQRSLGNNGYGDCGSVVGATYPNEISQLRELMPHSIFLIPGVGAQGGKAADVAAAFDERGLGAIINSSRGIIFAHSNEKYQGASSWQKSVDEAARELIQQVADETPAGNL